MNLGDLWDGLCFIIIIVVGTVLWAKGDRDVRNADRLTDEAIARAEQAEAQLSEAKAAHEITAEKLHSYIMALKYESECVEVAKAAQDKERAGHSKLIDDWLQRGAALEAANAEK